VLEESPHLSRIQVEMFVNEPVDAVFGSRFARRPGAPRAALPPPGWQPAADLPVQPGHEPQPDRHGDLLVPISYSSRTYAEGKKINLKGGVRALVAIARFALSDAVCRVDQYGSQILARLSRAPGFNTWMADTTRPFCGRGVLEIGRGAGNLSQQMIPRDRYVATDQSALPPDALGVACAASARRPGHSMARCFAGGPSG
jgi:hypothetical protein